MVRMTDSKRNITFSDHLIDGSPKNSVTVVSLPARRQLQIHTIERLYLGESE